MTNKSLENKKNPKYFTGIQATKQPPPFPAYYGEEKHIFVSYAHKDSERVFPILDELHKNGIRIWYDEGLQAGEDWFEYMKDKIIGCSGFLVFISEKFVASPHANEEAEFAHKMAKKIIAVRIDDTEISPQLLTILENNIILADRLDILHKKIKKLLD
ncbi:MAG: toll/interleukin-1 receptor domain-containing protein [Promethearchaeota archaeon]